MDKRAKIDEVLFKLQRQNTFLLDMIIEISLNQVSNNSIINLNPLRKQLLDLQTLTAKEIKEIKESQPTFSVFQIALLITVWVCCFSYVIANLVVNRD